jgi:long-chain acyl-CoA synthetase
MSETAVSRFLGRTALHATRPALRTLAAGGAPHDRVLTWRQWGEAARAFAGALIASGHRPGDAVAVLAGNVEAWPIADLGTMLAGGVSVGIYPTSAPAQVRQVLADCGAAFLVVDTPEQLAKVEAVRAELPALRVVIDAGGWDGWLARGADAGAEVDARSAAVKPDDIALLIYTSGSTGEPKGAAIPHRYLVAAADSIQDTLGLRAGDTSLSFLPFCHAAERVFGLHTRIACGMEAGLVGDTNHVWDAARAFGPTLFGGLPRFYEKAYEALRSEQGRATGGEAERWLRALELGQQRAGLRRAGQAVPAWLEEEWSDVAAPYAARLREMFGGRVRLATSGGATLPMEVAEYLDALGMSILGGYGLTEHLCVAFHRPDRYGFDTAGPAMPGTELRTAEDGEVLVKRGPLTFAGYHGKPEETRATFSEDGEWLHTGDLGELTERGELRVTGRKKELIALSNGKKVAPLPIEARLAQEEWIGQAVLFGEGERFVSALIALRPSAVETWARARALAADAPGVLAHPELLDEVQAAVDRVNAGLSRPEQVRRFALLERPLTAEAEELTPTLKLRRAAIAEKYGDRVRALYQTA